MFCSPGYLTIDDVFNSLDGWIHHIFTDEGIQRALPDKHFADHRSFQFYRGWAWLNIFDQILRNCGSLTITSPQGISLRASSIILQRSDSTGPNLRGELGLTSYDLDYIFINPHTFVVSTAFWENHARAIFLKYNEPIDLAYLTDIAVALEKFEGWSISILIEHVPDTREEIEGLAGRWWTDTVKTSVQTNTRSRGRPGKVSNVAEALAKLYPSPGNRPAWKVVQANLSEVGLEVSQSTMVRGWAEFVAERPPID